MMGTVNIFNLATGLLVFLRYFATLGTFLSLFLVRAHYSGPNDKLLSHYLGLETSLIRPGFLGLTVVGFMGFHPICFIF